MADDNSWSQALSKGVGQAGQILGQIGGNVRSLVNDLDVGRRIREGFEQAKETPEELRKKRPKLRSDAEQEGPPEAPVLAGSRKKGGRIKKTGIYRLHKGEFVIPAHTVQRLDKKRKASRRSGRR